MPILDNPRHERFAAFLAEGKSATDAYVAAGYKDSSSKRFGAHSLLQRHPEIKDRATQIIAENEARLAAAQQITKEKLIEWHNEIREQGKKSGQLSPAETAIKEISVLTGHRVERAEIGAPGEFDALQDDELERLLVQHLGELGFALSPIVEDRETEH
jgi:hypothetical protein